MLDLAYGDDVPAPLAEILEHHGRSLGLPLSTLECVGASLDLVEAFIVACERGHGAAFAAAVESGSAFPVFAGTVSFDGACA